MPDLGNYAFAVLASYGMGLGCLAALLAATLWRGRRVREDLARRVGGSQDGAPVQQPGESISPAEPVASTGPVEAAGSQNQASERGQ